MQIHLPYDSRRQILNKMLALSFGNVFYKHRPVARKNLSQEWKNNVPHKSQTHSLHCAEGSQGSEHVRGRNVSDSRQYLILTFSRSYNQRGVDINVPEDDEDPYRPLSAPPSFNAEMLVIFMWMLKKTRRLL